MISKEGSTYAWYVEELDLIIEDTSPNTASGFKLAKIVTSLGTQFVRAEYLGEVMDGSEGGAT